MSSFNPYHVYSSTKKVQKKGLSIHKKPVNRIGPYNEKDLQFALSVIRVAHPLLKIIDIPVHLTQFHYLYGEESEAFAKNEPRIGSITDINLPSLFNLTYSPDKVSDFKLTIYYNNISITGVKSYPATQSLNWNFYWANETLIDDNSREATSNIIVMHYSYTSAGTNRILNHTQVNTSSGSTNFIQTLTFDHNIEPVGSFVTDITYQQMYDRHITSDQTLYIFEPLFGQVIQFSNYRFSFTLDVQFNLKYEVY